MGELSFSLLSFVLAALIIVLILKFIFKLGIKTIIKFIINILIGGLILFLINYIPSVNITLDIWKSIVVGIFGVPGVIFVIIYYFIFER